MSKQAIDEFLSRAPQKVSDNCKVEAVEESAIPQILHISSDTNIKEMFPRISTRQMGSEDRTTPRVVGAPTLYGCILAYQSMHHDYMHSASKTKENKSDWKNGYKIYAIPYKFCLKPSKALVPDVANTDETWLVNYDEETRSYTPIQAGRVFCEEFRFKPRIGKKPQFEATIFVEVTLDGGLQFSKKHKLDKGHWKIQAPVYDEESWKNLRWDQDSEVQVEKITQAEWLSTKRSVADLLSLSETKVPAFLKW